MLNLLSKEKIYMDIAEMPKDTITYHGWRAKNIRQSEIDFVIGIRGRLNEGSVDIENIESDHHPIKNSYQLERPIKTQSYKTVNIGKVRHWGKIKSRNNEGKTLIEAAEEITEAPEWDIHLKNNSINNLEVLANDFIITSHKITQAGQVEGVKTDQETGKSGLL
eukprot:Lithocolla_globosa_v1_NODE_5374_length_1252_cov_4.517962.p1 type:complete len:164 gc:universal NODE_5374_length_1252_cov_4.517962:676-185(-)